MHTPSFYRTYGLPLFVQQFLVMESGKGELRDPLTHESQDQYYCILEGQMFKAERNRKRYTLYNARYNSTALWAGTVGLALNHPVCVQGRSQPFLIGGSKLFSKSLLYTTSTVTNSGTSWENIWPPYIMSAI